MEDGMTTTSILSRRTLVASAAALPALAVPALASADNPDAELLRLGAQLVPLEQERAVQMASDREKRAAVHAEVYRRTGIATRDAPCPIKDHPAYWDVRRQVSEEIWGPNSDDEDENGAPAWDRFHDRFCPILAAILESRPKTTDGLKIQARAAALAAAQLWDGNSPPDTHEKDFIEAACAFFGMDAEAIAKGTDQVQS
jgi:hypothetical protein